MKENVQGSLLSLSNQQLVAIKELMVKDGVNIVIDDILKKRERFELGKKQFGKFINGKEMNLLQLYLYHIESNLAGNIQQDFKDLGEVNIVTVEDKDFCLVFNDFDILFNDAKEIIKKEININDEKTKLEFFRFIENALRQERTDRLDSTIAEEIVRPMLYKKYKDYVDVKGVCIPYTEIQQIIEKTKANRKDAITHLSILLSRYSLDQLNNIIMSIDANNAHMVDMFNTLDLDVNLFDKSVVVDNHHIEFAKVKDIINDNIKYNKYIDTNSYRPAEVIQRSHNNEIVKNMMNTIFHPIQPINNSTSSLYDNIIAAFECDKTGALNAISNSLKTLKDEDIDGENAVIFAELAKWVIDILK